MSRECMEAAAEYSARNGDQIMLIATRRQVECAELGGGYVDDFSTAEFVDFARGLKANDLVICRDHGGPYQGNDEAGLDPDTALERSLTSFKEDVDAGFDLLHVDCSMYPGDVYEATAFVIGETMRFADSLGKTVLFEVGTEENVGTATGIDKFKSDLEFACRWVQPEFVVGQTGSLVMGTSQVGKFDQDATREMVEIAHSAGVRFKEHNVDYSPEEALRERRRVGVDAINVGPELGVAQTRLVMDLARKHGLQEHLEAFLSRSIESGKWKKWLHDEASYADRSVIAGHYCFTSDAYGELVEAIGREMDVGAAIRTKLVSLIDYYCKAMADGAEG